LLKNSTGKSPIVVVSHDLLVISRYVKSVACVNRRLHYHDQAEITGDMLETMYPCTVEDVCPVELVPMAICPTGCCSSTTRSDR
jgi:zinc transport system ATP-binding protein